MDGEQKRRDEATLSMAAAVALKGGQRSILTFQGSWTPWCDDPREVYRAVKPGTPGKRSVEVSFKTPCRRCEKCRTHKRLQWRQRAIHELQKATAQGRRSWMVTLTFSAHHLAGILMSAEGPLPAQVELAAYPHVQRYFKRLRKAGHRFRYLAVYERGEATGRSHYHVLLHELGPRPIPKAEIETWWRSNVHARLVSANDGAGSYVTKYLTKSLCRPRASTRYGNESLEISPPARRAPEARGDAHAALLATPQQPNNIFV